MSREAFEKQSNLKLVPRCSKELCQYMSVLSHIQAEQKPSKTYADCVLGV